MFDPVKMKGTGGVFDYVVVAHSNLLQYGLKPLLSVQGHQEDLVTKVATLEVITGLRIRAMQYKMDAVFEMCNVVETECDFIGWNKCNSKRASCVKQYTPFSTTGWQTKDDFVEGIMRHPHGGKSWGELATKFQTEMEPINTPTEITQFFEETVKEMVDNIFITAEKMGLIFKP